MTVLSPRGGIIHGYVAVIGPESLPTYFTGTTWSVHLDDAKVFRTPGGAKSAVRWWQNSDSTEHPLQQGFLRTLRTEPVVLNLEPRLV